MKRSAPNTNIPTSVPLCTNWLLTEFKDIKKQTDHVDFYSIKASFLNRFGDSSVRRLYDILNVWGSTGLIKIYGHGRSKRIHLSCFFDDDETTNPACFDPQCKQKRDHLAETVRITTATNVIPTMDNPPNIWDQLPINFENTEDFVDAHWLYANNTGFYL
jgi:hypothetical protein